MIVRLEYSGHYPAKRVKITDAECESLRKLRKVYGSVYDTLTRGTKEEKLFLKEIEGRPDIKELCIIMYY